ncbi:MAG: acyl-CoA carboxylase subunit epsilon [Gordonia sp. (in: high G+C Gram-positive bacteria)]
MSDDQTQSEPFLKIVRGAPDDAEIAALVTVLSAAASSGDGPAQTGPRDLWGQPTDLHRQSWGQPGSYVHG